MRDCVVPHVLTLVNLAVSVFLGWGFVRGLQTGQHFTFVPLYQFRRSSEPFRYWFLQTVHFAALTAFLLVTVVGLYDWH
jgi:hypothetical protein